MLNWQFNLYIDVCYAGSCAERAHDWMCKNHCKNGNIYYFDHYCMLDFNIFCSCLADELANDIALNKGGLWFNNLIAKGKKSVRDLDGKVFKIIRQDENG